MRAVLPHTPCTAAGPPLPRTPSGTPGGTRRAASRSGSVPGSEWRARGGPAPPLQAGGLHLPQSGETDWEAVVAAPAVSQGTGVLLYLENMKHNKEFFLSITAVGN